MKQRWSARGWMFAGLASLMLTGAAALADTEMDDPGEPDRAIGVIGAVLCGGEAALLRVNPLLGMNPWVLAPGLLGCGLMVLDMFT